MYVTPIRLDVVLNTNQISSCKGKWYIRRFEPNTVENSHIYSSIKEEEVFVYWVYQDIVCVGVFGFGFGWLWREMSEDAEINDSPSALQQYLRFTTTRKRFEPDHNLFTFPVAHSAPLNTIVPIIETDRKSVV